MAPTKPRKRRDTTFDDQLAGALARNGLNTILLDLKEDTSAVRATVEHLQREHKEAQLSRRVLHESLNLLTLQVQGIKQTIDEIAPKVIVLDTERAHKIGQRKLFQSVAAVVTKGRAAVVGGSAMVVALWHQWPAVKSLFRVSAVVALPFLLG